LKRSAPAGRPISAETFRAIVGFPERPAGPMHFAIIVEIDGQLVGLLADRVLDIVSFNTGKIQPVPQVARGTRADMLSGLVTVENGLIALIDLTHLVPEDAPMLVPSDEPA
jgi:purine-binding chemotaxis protein CheW